MCRRCYSTVTNGRTSVRGASIHAPKYTIASSSSASSKSSTSFQPFSESYCMFIGGSTNSTTSNKEVNPTSVAVDILLNIMITNTYFFDYFDDVLFILILASINREFNDKINGCDDIWRNLFNSIIRTRDGQCSSTDNIMNAYTTSFTSYPYKSDYDKLYYILPNIECNEGYRSNFVACYRKMRFVQHLNQNICHSKFLKFYTNFHKYKQTINDFGHKRYFSRNELIIIVKFIHSRDVSEFDYYDLESIRLKSTKIDEVSINPPNLILQRFSTLSINATVGLLFNMDTCNSFVSFNDVARSLERLIAISTNNNLIESKTNDSNIEDSNSNENNNNKKSNRDDNNNEHNEHLVFFEHAPIGAETPFECYLCY